MPYKKLPYNSVEIDTDAITDAVTDSAQFGTMLWSTVDRLRREKISYVYLKVSMLYSHYIPIAA